MPWIFRGQRCFHLGDGAPSALTVGRRLQGHVETLMIKVCPTSCAALISGLTHEHCRASFPPPPRGSLTSELGCSRRKPLSAHRGETGWVNMLSSSEHMARVGLGSVSPSLSHGPLHTPCRSGRSSSLFTHCYSWEAPHHSPTDLGC